MTAMDFAGRVAIVTGAAGDPGLGRSYALLLAARGAKVLVNDLGVGPDGRSTAPVAAERVVSEITSLGGEAIADGHSVAEPEGAQEIVAAAVDRWGRVDILVNNAGVNIPALFAEVTDADIRRTVDVHLMGTIWMCRAVWPQMATAGYGRIVNISSGTALGTRWLAAYGAAKAGVLGLTRTLAIEGADVGVKVNSLAPSAGTAASVFVAGETDAWMRDRFVQLTPEQVAPVAAFLAHEDCPVTGRHLEAAGGHANELFFTRTRGYDNPQLAIEDVRDALDAILDRSASAAVPDPLELDARRRFTPRPYRPRD
jgi:NAD(P)-dependent dehydrogenase (short-subunit alcohol dehydrogenase family)